jgi:NitT/TauT family transport system substrate-binding protein
MTYSHGSRSRWAIPLVGCAAALSALLMSVGSASAAKLATLRIVYNPNPTNTTIVVAQQQGYFKKYGINAVLTTSASSTSLLPALGKQFDIIGAGPASILQFAAGGYKPMLIASETVEGHGALRNTYLLSNSSIRTLADLQGKTVGAAALSGTQYDALEWTLKHDGLNPSSIHVLQVPFASMANDLASGTIQAALAIDPYAQKIQAAGYYDLGDPVETAMRNQTALSIGWVASSPWAVKHRTLVQDFIKSQAAALTWMKANNAAAQQVLVNDFQLPAAAAAAYPLTAFVSFAVKQSYLSNWVAPLKTIGALPSSFKTPIKQLVFPG